MIPKDWHERERAPGMTYAHRPLHYANTKMLTVKEAAEIMRRSAQGIYRLIAERKLWAQPDGKRYLIPEAAIEDYYLSERKRKGIA